ncbi:hypothetical protein DICPUDRAFT_76560 [Dictyostelium purpureum]|uniref:NADH:ubiquinone oxidoreductase intermediate-associated protein 30 domain-containing protein n=1 Tax=Dictyostelium purpureum TaxID=5786 RepID=F0ZDZ4_DICPU|nr:uncharacterized protein DICPUDRAFT_76560 [Dictyostelium purpureum]EGC37824.1 hypothetical protein DICPUDRAFT_76560 [Dictyostelium purpureum]|eukprot:XP_003285669.1 hypothetical protein DICPUDRAFT_76560 [Dictyostelium purpureum]
MTLTEKVARIFLNKKRFTGDFSEFSIFSNKANNNNELKKWRIVTDQEIGGSTKASLKIDEDNCLVFSGIISKKLPENNLKIKSSGYAGIFTKIDLTDLDLEKFNRISFRVKSDERTYSLALLRSQEKQTMYKAIFASSPDQWETVDMPFLQFFRVYKGVVDMNLEEIKKEGIDGIGLIQSDKKEGPFEIKIQFIKVRNIKTPNSLDSRMISTTGTIIEPPNY